MDRGTGKSIILACALAASACSGTHKSQPSPTRDCEGDASVLDQAQPEYPDEARQMGIHEAQVGIAVTIAPSGRLVRARIDKSSGYPPFDDAALIAADRSTYQPAERRCKPVEGTYEFRVTFSSNA